jgi:hypothetical protein
MLEDHALLQVLTYIARRQQLTILPRSENVMTNSLRSRGIVCMSSPGKYFGLDPRTSCEVEEVLQCAESREGSEVPLDDPPAVDAGIDATGE